MELADRDRAMLAGDLGEAARIAMRIIAPVAETMGAERLLDITGAHIDGCLYHGIAGLDFARRLRDAGARVAVPATLNVSSLDLLHPDLYRGDPKEAERSKELMDCYTTMGCDPIWTCSPYQVGARPKLGEHVAWAESNAIVFANSVLGARTHRYGDFIDIAAAITGRAPAAGLHLDANRDAGIIFNVPELDDDLAASDIFCSVLGHVVGSLSGQLVPAIVGLPESISEDQLKALGSAAASAGAVGLFHAIRITPEAPTLESVCPDPHAVPQVDVDRPMLEDSLAALTTAQGDDLDAISWGAPHYSVSELERLATLFDGRSVHASLEAYVNTSRGVLAAAPDAADALERAGVRVVVDTCTYITPIHRPEARVIMTDSAKWAFYAPGNLGVEVRFGSVRECVESAVAGRAVRTGGWFDAI